MLWEIEIRPAPGQVDREGARVAAECQALGAASIQSVRAAHSYLVQGPIDRDDIERVVAPFLVDSVVETSTISELGSDGHSRFRPHGAQLLNVLFKPGVTDNVAASTRTALLNMGVPVEAVATCRKYEIDAGSETADL